MIRRVKSKELEKNQKSFDKYTPEERSQLGRKGAYAKQKNEEKRATLRMLAQEFGRSPIKNPKILTALQESGINPNEAVQDMLLIMQCFNQIAKGNAKWADVYLRIRQESNPDFLDLKKEEMALRRKELSIREKLAEKQLSEVDNNDEERPQVVVYVPTKEE